MWGCRGLVMLIVVAWASGAVAQEAKALAAVPDGVSLSGKWDCVGAFRNATVHKASFEGEMVVGGQWLELREVDVQPATGYVAKYLIGYDAQEKRLVEFDANNFGAARYTSAEGWVKGVLTMTSAVSQDAKAPYAVNRFVYTVGGADAFSVDWQVSKTASLSWVQADHLECRRGGKS